jgi:hypothetical protein
MRARFLIPVVMFGAAACGEVKQSQNHADDNERELTTAEKQILIDYVAQQARDPDSLKFKFPPIKKNITGTRFENYCFLYNGKNAFGGYVGYLPVSARAEYPAGGSAVFTYTLISTYDIADIQMKTCELIGYNLSLLK